jgi:carbamoyl-phosphate synthase/aspartate carbamoyltransferase/dihydroorotase
LYLTREDIPGMGPGRCEVRPRLASPEDREALWENLEVIDCFATDHAPHTLQEKDGENPPPGFPGLETALPLMLKSVEAGRLSLQGLVERMSTNPRRIFNLPEQPDTWIEVDEAESWTVEGAKMISRCGWSPFEGWKLRGKVKRVVLRGVEVVTNGEVVAEQGSGRRIR